MSRFKEYLEQAFNEEEYQGFSNHATWNVSLWINNDEGLFNLVKDSIKGKDVSEAADIIEDLVKDVNGINDDLKNNKEKMSDVNFKEIAADFVEGEEDE